MFYIITINWFSVQKEMKSLGLSLSPLTPPPPPTQVNPFTDLRHVIHILGVFFSNCFFFKNLFLLMYYILSKDLAASQPMRKPFFSFLFFFLNSFA